MIRILLSMLLFFCINSYAKSQPHTVYLYNITKQESVIANHIDDVRPIASITKLMTAVVSLDYTRDMNERLMLSRKAGSSLPRQKYPRGDILNAMLVRSDNGSAETIAEHYPGGREEFLSAMNSKAREIGMTETHFDDPTGLLATNISTAKDLSILLKYALRYEHIKKISIKKHTIVEVQYKKKIRKINLNNTNSPILFEFDNVLVTKTGYTSKAGKCIAMVVEKGNQKYTIVILGAKTVAQRIDLIKDLMYNHLNDDEIIIEAEPPPLGNPI